MQNMLMQWVKKLSDGLSKYNDIEIPKNFSILKEKSVGDVKALLLIKNEN
jgi:hypothetical protein